MSWTDDRVGVLRKLWADGLSASQIAAELGGVTRNAVIGKVHRLGLSGRAKSSSSAGGRQKRTATRTASSYAKATRTRASASGSSQSAPAPKQHVVVDIAKPTSLVMDLLQLTDSTCKWPTGDPQDSDFSFCGTKSREGDPYCEYHCHLAYQPASDRRSRKQPQKSTQQRLQAS